MGKLNFCKMCMLSTTRSDLLKCTSLELDIIFFIDFSIFQFFEVCKWRSKTLTYDPRSNEVMDTENNARFGKYGSKKEGDLNIEGGLVK